MERKRYGAVLEDMARFKERKFCGSACFGKANTTDTPTLGTLRSRAHREVKRGTACETCGGIDLLGIHHLDENPANNSPENTMTLCAACHTKWHWEHGKKAWKEATPCAVCGQKSRRHALCQKHWFRFKKHGDPNLTSKCVGRGRFILVRVSPHD